MSKIIRPCRDDDRTAILAIINAAAEAYRGVIPADRWHEPYMPREELNSEIAAGVVFWGYEEDGSLAGVMGIQSVRDVDLIRHAYGRASRWGGRVCSVVLGQAAAEALASCTVTLGAAKRISAALPLGIDSGGLEEAGIIT
jgi:hypothetical protein